MQRHMLVKELRRHFPARMPEWVGGFTLLAWGAYVLLHPNVLDHYLFEGLVGLAHWWYPTAPAANVWGLVAFMVGMVRISALFINGAYSRFPSGS